MYSGEHCYNETMQVRHVEKRSSFLMNAARLQQLCLCLLTPVGCVGGGRVAQQHWWVEGHLPSAARMHFSHIYSPLSCVVLTQSWNGLAFAFSLTLIEIWVQEGEYLWVHLFYKYRENERGCAVFCFPCDIYPVYIQILSRCFYHKGTCSLWGREPQPAYSQH